MTEAISPQSQAILLLTSPLLAGGGARGAAPLTLGEYKKLVRILQELGKAPADFLGASGGELMESCAAIADRERFSFLLGRGFALSQALEDWRVRSIRVLSRADVSTPI